MTGRRFDKFLPYLFFIFLGYCIADLMILSFRDTMLPNSAPPPKPGKPMMDSSSSRGSYNSVISRNVFNSQGIIPDPLVEKGKDPKTQQQKDNEPVPSQLPLNLVGTIVHSNPKKSIANIELKGKNTTLAYIPEREIDKIATLVKVERNKAIIRNLNNNQLEFIEMKSSAKISFTGAKLETSGPVPTSNEVKQVAQGKFEIKRSDVLKYTQDMASVLQQAAMAPKRNVNGEIECFKFLSIQPASIYTQLGFQAGDCIKSVNGETVDSPAKAMELYNALKSSNNIKLGLERDGKDTEFDYTVK
jgi:general secretion pathway protein C